MPARAFGQHRKMGTRERSELFTARKLRSSLFAWTDVDIVELLSALTLALENRATVSFAPATGGAGIVLKLWQPKNADEEFAGSPEELNELLGLIVDGFQNGSEDIRSAVQLGINNRKKLKAK